ncbi:MAG: zinc ribbon domain-containing protein [Verrucomicrobia bacterium]|nr:zinc ribbon domain-containing protein [Verrucomicrobiota bacterium]
MNSKTPTSAVVFLVITLLASAHLANRVAELRKDQTVRAPQSRGLLSAGFSKFRSQIAWMRLIQLRGSMANVTKENAALLAGKYDRLTDLDPMFATAYEEGALDIGWQDPEASLRLLDKAQGVSQLRSWRIPFTAGFIAKTRLNNASRAVQYMEMASKQPDCPQYVHRFLINLKTALLSKEQDPVKILNLWVDYYLGGVGRAGVAGAPGMGRAGASFAGQAGEDSGKKLALNHISRLSSNIIAQDQKNLLTERDSDAKKRLQDRIEEVQKILKQVYAGTHICQRCYRPYNAGDEFCVHDGNRVEPYGICPKDKAVVRGAYCHKCGTKAN